MAETAAWPAAIRHFCREITLCTSAFQEAHALSAGAGSASLSDKLEAMASQRITVFHNPSCGTSRNVRGEDARRPPPRGAWIETSMQPVRAGHTSVAPRAGGVD